MASGKIPKVLPWVTRVMKCNRCAEMPWCLLTRSNIVTAHVLPCCFVDSEDVAADFESMASRSRTMVVAIYTAGRELVDRLLYLTARRLHFHRAVEQLAVDSPISQEQTYAWTHISRGNCAAFGAGRLDFVQRGKPGQTSINLETERIEAGHGSGARVGGDAAEEGERFG